MKQYAIIVAGGKGKRMEGNVPKQFLLLNGKPVLMHSITAFHKYSSSLEIIVVLPEDQLNHWEKLCSKFHFNIRHKTTIGGSTRYESVKNGIAETEDDGYIAIHDGARPLVTTKLITSCFNAAQKKGNATPVIEVNESVRQIKGTGNIPLNRSTIRICQTPQVFRYSEIKKAYKQPFSKKFTDDASVLESAGYQINLIPGQASNIKITTQTDLVLAETLLSRQTRK